MATVESYLNGRSTFYTPNESIRASARMRGARIEKRLDDEYVADLFETGSLTHGTGIWYHSDVDYFVKFYDVRPTPQASLDRIKSSMVSLYPSTSITISRPAVKLDFTQQVKVELVPAYSVNGEDGVFWIPDPTDSSRWMKSSPKKHLDYVNSARDKRENTKQAIRLIKIWKAIKSVPVSSFYLEMRMAKFMKESTSQMSVSDAVATVIYDLYKIGFASMQDPTSWGKMFSACSSEANRVIATSMARTAAGHALPARTFELIGEHDEAIAEWKKVLEY